MSSLMTISEINNRFDSEWVLVEDPETTDMVEVMAGKVLWHSKDRDEVYRKARELRSRHAAILFTGSWPEGMIVIL